MKRVDTLLVLDAWDDLAPSPDIDLADRVMRALDAPVAGPRSRRWPLVAGLLVAAGLLAPLLVAPRTPPRAAIAQNTDADLGLQTD